MLKKRLFTAIADFGAADIFFLSFLTKFNKRYHTWILLLILLPNLVIAHPLKDTSRFKPHVSKFGCLNATSAHKDTCVVGFFLKNIYDLQPEQFAYSADFWVWFNHKQPKFRPLDNVEFINAKVVTCSDQYIRATDSLLDSETGRVTLAYNWELENYPFDRQILKVELEAGLDTTKMILTPMLDTFKLYKRLKMPGWNILSHHTDNGFVTYDADFGECQLKSKSTYSRITYVVEIERNSWGLFFKLLLGLYVAFFVAFLVFFVPPKSDQRFSLCVGGLFAAVANKYVTDSNIPVSISFSFVDQVHVLTFVFILGMLVLSVISLRMGENGRHERRLKFDRNWAWIILFTYLILNIILIVIANIQPAHVAFTPHIYG